MSTTRITDNDYADVALYDKVNTIANEIDNEVSKKANSSNTVTTDTAQTINARKTFNQRLDVKADIIRSIDIDPSTTPTSNIYLVPWTVDNSNQSVRAYQQVAYFTSGVLQNTLGLRRTVNGTNIFNGIDLQIDKDGNKSINVVTPPTTSNSANIATTAFVKSVLSSSGNGLATLISNANGNAIKFSNGLIMQWGSFTQTGNNVITLPTAFSSSNYSISFCYIYDTTNDGTAANVTDMSIRSKTSTSFTSNYVNRNKTKMWIAIGY